MLQGVKRVEEQVSAGYLNYSLPSNSSPLRIGLTREPQGLRVFLCHIDSAAVGYGKTKNSGSAQCRIASQSRHD